MDCPAKSRFDQPSRDLRALPCSPARTKLRMACIARLALVQFLLFLRGLCSAAAPVNAAAGTCSACDCVTPGANWVGGSSPGAEPLADAGAALRKLSEAADGLSAGTSAGLLNA